MKKKKQSILLTTILLCIVIIPIFSSLYATTLSIVPVTAPSSVSPPLNEHKQIINEYIDELKIIQDRTFQLLQLVLDTPLKDPTNFNKNLNLINNDAATLRAKVLNYQKTVPADTTEFRDILLILNALNYSKNALFQLESLAKTTSNVEKSILLEEFFKSRIDSINALNIIRNLIM